MGFSLGGALTGGLIGFATGGPLGAAAGAAGGSGLLSSGSSPAVSTQTTTNDPQQQPFINRVFGEAEAQFDAGPFQSFQGQQVAGFDPATLQAQVQQLEAAGQLTPQIRQALASLTSRFGTLDPANDPTINRFADAATRPITQLLQEQLIPGIRSQAISQGAFGGSRQAITEGQAVRGATQAIADTRARIFQDAFKTQSSQQLQALGLAPSLFQQATLPASLTSQVGAQRETQAQAELDAAIRNFEFDQNAPAESLARFSDLINQFSSGGTITKSTSAATPGVLQQGISAGILGGQAAPQISSGINAIKNFDFNSLFGGSPSPGSPGSVGFGGGIGL